MSVHGKETFKFHKRQDVFRGYGYSLTKSMLSEKHVNSRGQKGQCIEVLILSVHVQLEQYFIWLKIQL